MRRKKKEEKVYSITGRRNAYREAEKEKRKREWKVFANYYPLNVNLVKGIVVIKKI